MVRKIMFKVVWHSGVHPEPVLAICSTKQECLDIMSKRKRLWRDSAGYDITSQCEIIKFKLSEEK